MKYLLITFALILYSCTSVDNSQNNNSNDYYVLEIIQYFDGCKRNEKLRSPNNNIIKCEEEIPAISRALILEKEKTFFEIRFIKQMIPTHCINAKKLFTFENAKEPIVYKSYIPANYYDYLLLDDRRERTFDVDLPKKSLNIDCVYVDADGQEFLGKTSN